MRTVLKKWTSVGAVVLVASLGLAACGSDEGGSEKKGSGEAAVGEDAATELTQENFFTEISKAQLDAGSSHMTMNMGAQGGMKAEGDIVVAEKPEDTRLSTTMTMEGGQGGGKMETRLVDGVLFLNMGEATQNKFAKVDLTDESNPVGKQFGPMFDNMNPAKQLELMEDSVKSFEQKGDAEELDGVEATPYVITVDTAKVLEQYEGSLGDSSQVPESITYTMYIGPDNLPRRISTELMGQKLDVDYSKWGEDVTIEAPSDDEITDQDPFAGLGGAA